MEFELSELAHSNIKDIARYTIQYFDEAQADEYLDGLFYSFDLLTDNPKMGRAVHSDLSGNLRRFTYRSHYVVYEIRDKVIRIATIRNVRQQLPDHWR
jgi:plasmid stabilization system protein ParE